MAGDDLPIALFGLRIGLNLTALLVIGLSLHGALGVVQRSAFRRFRGLVIAATGVTAVLATARVGFLNVQLGDASSVFDPDLTALSWLALGPSTLAFVVGALIAVIGGATGSRLALAAGAVILSAGFALTGHTQALESPGAMPAAASLHALIAGFWVVAPLTLWPAPSLDGPQLLGRLHRFSSVAVFAIPVLLVLGAWLAWTLARGWDGLVATSYGQLLLAKLTLGLAAMGMGALNKQVLTTKVAEQPERGRRWLRCALSVEAALFAAAILAVSAATSLTGAGE